MPKTKRELAKENVIKAYEELDKEVLPEEIAKWGAIDTQILHRFCFEPRSSINQSGGWLVVYDKYAQDYVREPKSPRAYLRFPNSNKAVQYFRERYIKENKKEE